jgi:Lysophospholipase L1 and related esterases
LTFADCFAQQNVYRNQSPNYCFDFGKGAVREGYIPVTDETMYTDRSGYGIDFGTTVKSNTTIGKDSLTDGFLSSDQPFYFSVRIPEGNYNVRIYLGDDYGVSDIAIRAENRRMMVNQLQTDFGAHQVVDFTINVRDSLISTSKQVVGLKPREHKYLSWDNKLTLEFNGKMPKVNAIEIFPSDPRTVSVFLAGNSTVVDGPHEPFTAWGQMFPFFFQAGKVAIVNLAESGETLSSFIGERRLKKMLVMMKPGDYAFVEFGHNDQKQKGNNIGAFTSYTKDLAYFVDAVKQKGGIPVLVTSVQRRNFDRQGKIVQTLGDYPEAVRRVAKRLNTYLIDLNAMSQTLFEAMGETESLKAFAHFPAHQYPGRDTPIADNTHFRPFGAFEIAKLILKGVCDTDMPLASLIKAGVPIFDPQTPDTYESFYWPESPGKDATKPEGN